MTTPITEAQVARAQVIIRNVVILQRELFELGLHATAARMGLVNERIGWELAEKMKASGLVGKEEKRRQLRHAALDAKARGETAQKECIL